MILWLGISLVAMLGIAWVFRFAGQAATGNAPKFRDMPERAGGSGEMMTE